MKKKINTLDSLEILNFENQKTEYPSHYHETYCISLIHKGVFLENELIAPSGSIVISHPYEVHHNKLVETADCTFSTLYINQDLIDFISPFEHTSFQYKVIHDGILYAELKSLINFRANRKENFIKEYNTAFCQVISKLTQLCGSDQPFFIKEPSSLFKEVEHYITSHLDIRIDLSYLAKIVGMSKFQFIRWFKKQKGITPFEFVLLKRVSYGKRLIQEGVPLIEVSLDTGFYDQSHFSNYFKKYVGMSPKAYRQNRNIFQEP